MSKSHKEIKVATQSLGGHILQLPFAGREIPLTLAKKYLILPFTSKVACFVQTG